LRSKKSLPKLNAFVTFISERLGSSTPEPHAH
jgi:hypothetical protein